MIIIIQLDGKLRKLFKSILQVWILKSKPIYKSYDFYSQNNCCIDFDQNYKETNFLNDNEVDDFLDENNAAEQNFYDSDDENENEGSYNYMQENLKNCVVYNEQDRINDV